MSNSWRKIPCCISELRLDITLACGQSFRWREIEPGTWRSVLSGRVWTLKQTDTHILYQVHNNNPSETMCSSGDRDASKKTATGKKRSGQQISEKSPAPDVKRRKSGKNVPANKELCGPGGETCEDLSRSILVDYFQLDVDLGKLYTQWADADPNFQKVAKGFPGVRILRQDPVENLISFICSSNNNISRITGMVDKLCTNYGSEVGVVDGVAWHSFPSLMSLSGKGIEDKLRKLGFGYRAKFINQTAKKVSGECGGEEWLWNLRSLPYEQAHSELLRLPGVGSKVADCVCLMSMDKCGAIPVDTHVWQIAARDYMKMVQKTKSLTDRTYREIGNFFRELFGEYAGWAHSVLFSADLKKFQETPKNQTPTKAKQKQSSGPNVKSTKVR